jgi:hypothetical protein
MVDFHTKNPNLGKFWRALEWEMLEYIFYNHLEYFTASCHNLGPFVLVCYHLVHFPRLVCLDLEKSCNPGSNVNINIQITDRQNVKIYRL